MILQDYSCQVVIVIGVPVISGIGSSYAYDNARNEGSFVSLRLFNLFLHSIGFLFSHLEAIVTGVEVEKQSLTLITWGNSSLASITLMHHAAIPNPT